MSLRYRKSIKLAPGVKLNVGKKSIGVSVGNKYGGISVNSKTGTRARVSAPGTGMSYTTKIGSSTSKTASPSKSYTKNANNTKPSEAKSKQEEYEDLIKKQNLTKKKAQSCRTYSLIFSALFILIGLLTISYGWGWLFIILGILFACSAHYYKNLIKACFSSQTKKD